MQLNSFPLYIHGSVRSIFEDTWAIIKPHMAYMSFVWAIFYIPTNLFVIVRSGDMVRHMNSGSMAVIPVMLLLSLLGTVPNIVLILLVRERECEDCSSLVGEAFRKLPRYITTTLAMAVRIIPFIFLSVIVSLLLSMGMEALGMSSSMVLTAGGVLIVVVILYAVLMYSLSVPFYLMKGIPDFRATRFSRVIFKMNVKKVALAFFFCTFLPFLLNMGMLFLLDNGTADIVLGFLVGYYMFMASGFFAGIFNHVSDRPEGEISAEESQELQPPVE